MDRFWSKVARKGPDECWEWLATKNPSGYGNFTLGVDQKRGAHRMAWELTFGPIPDGLYVCHRCDNPSCCNPAHLFLGTGADNQADRVRKGRGSIGEKNRRALLTRAAVERIREEYAAGGVTYRELAQRLGVSHSCISHAIRGRSWREG